MTPLAVPAFGKVGFTLLTPARTGLAFTNRLSDDAAAANQIRLNGSGVALGDIDGDDRVDVFLCGLDGANRLYRNLGGLRFEDITRGSAIALPGTYCTGAALADIDGDGDLDLLVNAIGEGTRLFLNDGTGTFAERPDAGLERRGGSMSLALADVDGDGDLDLYVTNYRTTTIRTTGFALLNVDGRRVVPPALREDLELTPEGRVLEHGEPDGFYLNDGTGRFQRVPWTTGGFLDEDGQPLTRTPRDWGLSAVFRDLNQDGLPDLYVCGDFHSGDRVWLNQEGRQFRALPRLALRNTSTFSMTVDFADVDRDGWDDFFVSDMLDLRRERRLAQITSTEPNPSRIGVYDDRPQYARNTLQWNRGDGTYAEIAHFANLDRSGWSWGVAFIDVDLDGFEDLLMTTGHLFDVQDLDAAARIERMGPVRRDQIPRKLLQFPRLPTPKMAFRNGGNLRFEEMGAPWGFADVGIAHGLAFADLDGDGDLDVVVNNLNAPVGLYRNESPAPRVSVQLVGEAPNTRGIGARIRLLTGDFTQAQEFAAGGRYLSSDAPARMFAWPEDVAEGRLEVAWRSGRVTTVDAVRRNCRYTIRELPDAPSQPATATAGRRPAASASEAPPLFVDVSDRLNHRHAENAFDDFQRQPLLPNKLSQAGPGVAFHDVNGDGWDDVIVGTGQGGRLAIFRNDRGTGFTTLPVPGDPPPASRDVLGMVEDPTEARGLLIAFSNYEDGRTNGVCLGRIDSARREVVDVWPDLTSAVGSVAVADYDADGDLEVFVAGRCVPGRYPAPATSALLRREAGRWESDPSTAGLFTELGLVTGALWSDLNGDGFPELVLACEWGPLRIFRNDRGRLAPWDPLIRPGTDTGQPATPLSRWTGLWTTIGSGDFDGDGRPDLVAGNWGLNTRYRATPAHPLRLYFGDFDESGTLDIFETQFDPALGQEMPERDLLALRQAVPRLLTGFSSYASYAMASIAQVLGEAYARSRSVEAGILTSLLLLNRGDTWEAQPLPDQAQWSPVMGIAVGDVDGDGDEDVFLSQNFFAVQPTTSRNDAGTGLLLRNNGAGQFMALRPGESGLRIYGEQRGCALGDFNADGRLDLLVGQNGAETRLYRNAEAQPGLRVRIEGPLTNPRGIGVALRVRRADGWGPVKELQAGSGGLSQNSLVAVMGAAKSAVEIESRWPGGNVTRTAVPPGTREIVVSAR